MINRGLALGCLLAVWLTATVALVLFAFSGGAPCCLLAAWAALTFAASPVIVGRLLRIGDD